MSTTRMTRAAAGELVRPAQLRRMLTTPQRTLTAVADPHMAMMPDDALTTWMNAQFTSLSRTIEITVSPPGSSTGRTPAPA